MAEFVQSAVLTANAAVFLLLLILYIARRAFPERPEDQRRFILVGLAVLAIRLQFVVAFAWLFPDRVVSTDGVRYLLEMQHIAEAPWRWNPLTGSGPYYNATPKMGMSYLYGVIMFVHGVGSPLYAALVLNVVFGVLTSLIVFFLTARLSVSRTPALLAMLLTAVYPETLFWTARIVRENVTLFLVPALVYASIRLHETYRLRYSFYALVVIGSLLLVRAQLALFAILIVGYFAIRAISARNRTRAVLAAALGILLLYAGYSIIETQIRRAAGREALRLLSLDPSFWSSQSVVFLENIGAVLTPVARESYGIVGLLMLPFALLATTLLILAIFRFRRIFTADDTAAGLLLFLSVSFLVALALVGRINIRFRSTVAPLLLPLISVSAHYYWHIWVLPRFRPRARRLELGSAPNVP